MGRGKKRKNYYSDFKDPKRWKGVLSVGMKGFLCTCNMRVKECIREAYNLLNLYAEKYADPEEKEVDDECIEDELERELKGMRKKPSEKMFQVVETGADNTVFIRTTMDDPTKLADEIFSDIYTSKQNKSRFLLRLVPIEVTCKAYVDDIRKAADQMLDGPFKCDPVTFNVFYKARYNSSLLRDEVLSAMVTLVKDRNPAHKVDLTMPQKTVIVEVIKGVCCLSVVNDFYKYRKYNLLEAAKGEHSRATDGKESAASVEVSSAGGIGSKPEADGDNAKSTADDLPAEVDSKPKDGEANDERINGSAEESTEDLTSTPKENSAQQTDDHERTSADVPGGSTSNSKPDEAAKKVDRTAVDSEDKTGTEQSLPVHTEA